MAGIAFALSHDCTVRTDTLRIFAKKDCEYFLLSRIFFISLARYSRGVQVLQLIQF